MNTATLSVTGNQNSRTVASPAPSAEPDTKNDSRAVPNGTTGVPEPKTGRKLTLKRAAGLLILAAAGIGVANLAQHWWTTGRYIQSTDDAYVGGDVTVIAPKVSSFITQIAVRDNQQVRAGDLLVKLDARDWQAALAKAEAAVAIQQAAQANLDATRHLQEAIIAKARAEIAATDAEAIRTHDDQVRYQSLVTNGAESVQSFQKADAVYKQALAATKSSGATLSVAQRQLEVIGAQKQQTQASLEQSLADRELARLNLSYTELRAPIDATVGNRSAQVGAFATAGSQLISLVPTRGLWIDANFKESQVARMHPGSPVTLKIDSIPNKTFQGHVESIAPATGAKFSVLPPENATGNFTRIVQRLAVRIVLDDETAARGELRPGLSVTADVDTRTTDQNRL
ncbi:MAG TPA: HlyD family secretion protein [Candidatus Limnocylindria bacterium]|jgi:membrane fusion protein (multidrug efflux system)|nr:HlyD family secretion protein [Candidatus Limnocylindria bacterium]